MAIPFLNNINLSDNQLLNAKLHITSTAPIASAGQIYFDSTADPGGDPPTYDLTAKYYSNPTDNWVSLKEYTFPVVLAANGYITSVITGTTPKPIITFNLNATDGDAAETSEGNGIRYLSKNNKWAEIDAIPGTYAWTISDNVTPEAGTAGVASGDTLQIAASSDLTSTLTGQATTTKVLTVGLKVGPQVSGPADNYVMNQGTAIATSSSTLPFNSLTAGNPPDGLSTVKKTTFGTIPVEALTLVKNYIDSSVAGGLIYQGGFDGLTGFVTGTSDYLDDRTGNNQIAVNKGWTYTVTTAGTFYGEVVEVGDVLIAEDNLAAGTGALTDWTTVQNNVDLASLTQVGIGNVNAANLPAGTAPELDGLSVTYSSGTAIVGLNIDSLTTGLPTTDNTDVFIPYYDDDASTNKKLSFAQLSTQINAETSFSGTIGDGSVTSIRLEDSGAVAPNINHDLGIDSSSFMIQLVDVASGETVYADVTRGPGGQVQIDFATAPAVNGIRVLIQKIG